jgi:hypothetical protein
VIIYGDGSKPHTTVTGDSLSDFHSLLQIGTDFVRENEVQPISKVCFALFRSLFFMCCFERTRERKEKMCCEKKKKKNIVKMSCEKKKE